MAGERTVTVHGRPPTYNVVKKHSPHKQRDLRDAWKRACYIGLGRAGVGRHVWAAALGVAAMELDVGPAGVDIADPGPRVAKAAMAILDGERGAQLRRELCVEPEWQRVEIVAQPFYADRRNLPDTDGIAPAVKWLLDCAVDLGALAGDNRDHVRRVELLFAWVDRDLPGPRMTATIRPVE